MNKIALIDMDGTIADYDKGIRAGLHEIAAPHDPPLPKDIHKAPEWLDRRADFVKSRSGFWRELKPIDAGFRVVNALEAAGYSLTVLTKGPHRTRSAWTEKAEWCDHYLPHKDIVMVDGKEPELHKGLVYGKVLFDDFPPYVEAWLKHRPRGKVIMLKHHYNEDFEHESVLKIDMEDSQSRIHSLVRNFLDG